MNITLTILLKVKLLFSIHTYASIEMSPPPFCSGSAILPIEYANDWSDDSISADATIQLENMVNDVYSNSQVSIYNALVK